MGSLSLNRDFEAMFPLSRAESPPGDDWRSMRSGRGCVGRGGRGTLASLFRGRGSLAGAGALILGARRCPRSREITPLPQPTGRLRASGGAHRSLRHLFGDAGESGDRPGRQGKKTQRKGPPSNLRVKLEDTFCRHLPNPGAASVAPWASLGDLANYYINYQWN